MSQVTDSLLILLFTLLKDMRNIIWRNNNSVTLLNCQYKKLIPEIARVINMRYIAYYLNYSILNLTERTKSTQKKILPIILK